MPAAVPSDLGSYLGVDVSLSRAEFFLELARDLVVAESGIPAAVWPAGLRVVQITVAARGYVNPRTAGQLSVGARSETMRDVGMYLTDAERRAVGAVVGGSGSGLVSVPLSIPGQVPFR